MQKTIFKIFTFLNICFPTLFFCSEAVQSGQLWKFRPVNRPKITKLNLLNYSSISNKITQAYFGITWQIKIEEKGQCFARNFLEPK